MRDGLRAADAAASDGKRYNWEENGSTITSTRRGEVDVPVKDTSRRRDRCEKRERQQEKVTKSIVCGTPVLC